MPVIRDTDALAEQLLLDCADLQIIATSREPLAVPGELTMRVPALPLPSAEDEGDPRRLLDSAAVRLFVDRAQLADADFQLVAADGPALAQVCRRLDGIPLALELAAAQMRTMTVQTLLEGLNDRFRLLVSGRGRPRRQQTLEATVEWSFARLRPDEQSVFARLSVLGGGFTVETARRVAAGGAIRSQDVLPLTARLVEQSLLDLEARGGRYRMPETIREYGRLVLRTSGETGRVLRAAAADADGLGAAAGAVVGAAAAGAHAHSARRDLRARVFVCRTDRWRKIHREVVGRNPHHRPPLRRRAPRHSAATRRATAHWQMTIRGIAARPERNSQGLWIRVSCVVSVTAC